MDRKNAWIVAGSVVAGFFVLGLTQLFAQRFAHDERSAPAAGAVGRYQVVRATAEVVTLLDTVTGDLYNAVPTDLKPYNTRPGSDRSAPAWGRKDKPTDKGSGKDRNFNKDAGRQFKFSGPSDLTIKQGTEERIHVSVKRGEYTGPIKVRFVDLPAGVDSEGVPPYWIEKGADKADVTLKAAKDAKPINDKEVKVKWKAGDDEGECRFKVTVK